jgi:Ran GTPase-activating protein (RanGAP) involved in mRNA processing and transport
MFKEQALIIQEMFPLVYIYYPMTIILGSVKIEDLDIEEEEEEEEEEEDEEEEDEHEHSEGDTKELSRSAPKSTAQHRQQ